MSFIYYTINIKFNGYSRTDSITIGIQYFNSVLCIIFKVFGDTTRIKILSVLRVQEMCVCDIADRLSMTQSAISHQLRVLKQMDLVKNRREGKTIYYSLADNHIAMMSDLQRENLGKFCRTLYLSDSKNPFMHQYICPASVNSRVSDFVMKVVLGNY